MGADCQPDMLVIALGFLMGMSIVQCEVRGMIVSQL
jgi:hypothetical protein